MLKELDSSEHPGTCYFQMMTNDKNENMLTYVGEVNDELRFPFPYNDSTLEVNERLKAIKRIHLDEEEKLIRIQMLYELPVSEDLIHSILAQYVISEVGEDRRDSNVFAFPNFKGMPLREFVSVAGYDNLFFVIDYVMSDCSLICVEVNPTKPIAYGVSIFYVKQVTKTVWKGQGVSMNDIQELMSSSDEDFINKLMTVPNVSKPEEDFMNTIMGIPIVDRGDNNEFDS